MKKKCELCKIESMGSGCAETSCPQRAARHKEIREMAVAEVREAGPAADKLVSDFSFLTHIERNINRVLTEDEVSEALQVRRKAVEGGKITA